VVLSANPTHIAALVGPALTDRHDVIQFDAHALQVPWPSGGTYGAYRLLGEHAPSEFL
jgi:hypothetical protein